MAPAIGMQMSLVLLGLSSGLQLGRHRYARKVNRLAEMGAGGDSLEPHLTLNAFDTNNSFHMQTNPDKLTKLQDQLNHINLKYSGRIFSDSFALPTSLYLKD